MLWKIQALSLSIVPTFKFDNFEEKRLRKMHWKTAIFRNIEAVLLNSAHSQHQHILVMFHFIYEIANISICILLVTKQRYGNVLRML